MNVTAGAAAHQAINNAIMASGAIIKITTNDFISLLAKIDSSVVVEAKGGIFTTKWNYITNYRGFYFFTKSKDRLGISSRHELIRSNKIWVPNM